MEITKNPQLPILIVDDEEDVLKSYNMTLQFDGLNNLILCKDSREVLATHLKKVVSVVILDLFMPHISGQELLEKINSDYPEIPVIIITSANKVETAVECMKLGAFDYMVKPVEKSRLISGIKRALEIRELQKEIKLLKSQMLSKDIEHPEAFLKIITNNDKMKSIFKYIEAIATSPKPVLITGESGVGKELIAQAIHTLSNNKGNFVAVNVAGLDDNMFSDTLFGHKKGSFTGATEERSGLIEQAKAGTLFLDEIGDLEATSQVKLLRLLQQGEYYALGSDVVKTNNSRVIAATNTDIELKKREGSFRNDLYYRLMTHHIHIPPLRERLDDLPFFVEYFLEESAKILKKQKPTTPEETCTLLSTYHFPGNIRELQSLIFDAVSRHKSGILSLDCFKEYISKHRNNNFTQLKESFEKSKIIYNGPFPTLKQVEDFFVTKAMQMAKGNQSIAAELLGVSQSTLSRKFKKK